MPDHTPSEEVIDVWTLYSRSHLFGKNLPVNTERHVELDHKLNRKSYWMCIVHSVPVPISILLVKFL